MTTELGRIAGSLNQIARHFNTGGIHSQEMRTLINQSISEIFEMKYAVTKMGGDFRGVTQDMPN